MTKQIGKIEESIELYTQALHIYEDCVGKAHPSYAITLGNLGAGYKAFADRAIGMDRLQLLERAKEALTDSYSLLQQAKGNRYLFFFFCFSFFLLLLLIPLLLLYHHLLFIIFIIIIIIIIIVVVFFIIYFTSYNEGALRHSI